MVVNHKGYASLVIPPDIKIVRRQDAPVGYDMIKVAYVARPKFINEKDGIFEGRVRSVHVPLERAIDIDNLLDFKMAECLIKTKTDNENN